ncbi:MAG: TetR/AcrR family transcriptional regulator [Eubacterium sp.]
MYCGSNPTALKSQKWLMQSLLDLMNEKPYTQITIGEICKNADLSRQTFYNFFKTKDDILRLLIHTKCELRFSEFSYRPTLQETVDAIAQLLEENRNALLNMINNNLDSIISDEMVKCVNIYTEKFVINGNEDHTFNYRVVLLSGALTHLLIYWFKENEPISTAELTRLLTGFLKGELYEFG